MCDLDADNDGILNADECGGDNLIIRGDFTNLPPSTGFLNPTQFASVNPDWTFTSTGTGINNQILWNTITAPFVFGNGIRFQRDGQPQALTQTKKRVHHNETQKPK